MASDNFKNAIRSDTREIKQYAEIKFTDEVLVEGAQVFSPQLNISNGNEVFEDIRHATNYATFERAFFKDDGSFFLPSSNYENLNAGFISDNTFEKNNNLYFSAIVPYLQNLSVPAVTFLFFGDAYPVSGYLLVGYRMYQGNELITVYEEYPFENNSQNTLTIWLDGSYTDPIVQINLNVSEFSNTQQRLRLAKVYFGLLGFYENNDLLKITLDEEFSPINTNIPTSELTVTTLDLGKNFEPLNRDGYYKYLEIDNKMTANVGCVLQDGSTEFVDLGTYFLKSWVKNSDNTVTFTGQNIICKLQETCFFRKNHDLVSAGEYIEELMDYLNITNYEINIDEELNIIDFLVPLGTGIELLQQFALFTRSHLLVKRDGTIVITKDDPEISEGYSLSMFLKEPKVNTLKPLKQIIVKHLDYPYNSGTDGAQFSKTFNADPSGITIIKVQFEKAIWPYETSTSVGTVIKSFLGAFSWEIHVQTNQEFTLTINGHTFETKEITNVYPINEVSNGASIEVLYSYLGANELQGKDDNDDIAEFIRNNSHSLNLSANFIQDPEFTVGKKYPIETSFGEIEVISTKNHLEAGGYLTGNFDSEAD